MREQLKSVIAETLGLDTANVTPDLSRESGVANWDSLGHLRLITAVEETFGIRMTMDEIEGITTAGELDDRVAKHTDNE